MGSPGDTGSPFVNQNRRQANFRDITMRAIQKLFGLTPLGEKVFEFSVINEKGYGFSAISFGACLTSIIVPDKTGTQTDVCLGFPALDRYEGDENGCAGAVVGRVGGRIANAQFNLDGNHYVLTANNGKNTLHSGNAGFDKRVWAGQFLDGNTVSFQLVSENGDQGFPGTLSAEIRYSFTEDNTLRLEYHGNTDKTTLCDMTNHCYFNLNGHDSGDILAHHLQINANWILDVGTDLIPTGKFLSAEGVPYSFLEEAEIGKVIECSKECEGVAFHKGIDTNYCFGNGKEMKEMATLYSRKSGIEMQVWSDQPSIHIYTGMCLDFSGKNNSYYSPYSGVAMLTEHYTDSVHHPEFPSYILTPEENYFTATEYRFGIR